MIQAILVLLILSALACDAYLLRSRQARQVCVRSLVVLFSVTALGMLVFLFINHIHFPLNLEVMETVVLQHAQRAATGQPIYSVPDPSFIALAYNPLYYVLSVPLIWLLGPTLFALRLVSILGAIGIVALLYLEASSSTQSRILGLAAAGLFAISYRATDAYIDTAHSDTWFVFTALLGFYLLNKNRSRSWDTVGLLFLVSSFWFKQHGALFVIGGLLFLSVRYGVRASIPYWAIAFLLGPVLYILAGPSLFGSQMLAFTLFTPMRWSTPSIGAVKRGIKFILLSYPLLFAASAWAAWSDIRQKFKNQPAWTFFWLAAVTITVLGLMDPGSANNVFLPIAVSSILLGVLQLHRIPVPSRAFTQATLGLGIVAFSFVPLVFNPIDVLVPGDSKEAYDGFVAKLRSLPGQVFAPNIGQLPEGFRLNPAVHWVALEDMIRGPGVDVTNNPNTKRYLLPALEPQTRSFLVLSYQLDQDPLLEFLSDCYSYQEDWGEQFSALDVLPGLFSGSQGSPRYLYEYSGPAGRCIE